MSATNPFEWVWPDDLEPAPDTEYVDACESVLIENDDAPDELGIFPPGGDESNTVWVAASGESFISLEDAR